MSNARELAARLAELLRREHVAMADFLVTLADFDRRWLWLDLGYASLFDYLHRELGLSKGAAHYRKTAAELVQRFPEIVEPLRDGRLCVTSVVHLAKVLTPENRVEMLPRFFHRSRREAAEVAAAILPAEAAPRRDVVTPVRVAAPVAGTTSSGAVPGAMKQAVPALAERAVQPAELKADPAQATVQLAEPRVDPAQAAVQPGQLRVDPFPVDSAAGASDAQPRVAATPRAYPPARPARRDTAEPVTAELSRLHVTVSRRFLAKLEAARAALSHARPGATAEELLEAGLDLLLAQHAKRKGLVAKPRSAPPPAKADHVPAHVKRAVWTRDGGRCQWPVASGGICGSTHRVELDHEIPRARGGPSTVDNVRLLCKLHNDVAARRVYGDEWMDRFTRAAASRREEPALTSGDELRRPARAAVRGGTPVAMTPSF